MDYGFEHFFIFTHIWDGWWVVTHFHPHLGCLLGCNKHISGMGCHHQPVIVLRELIVACAPRDSQCFWARDRFVINQVVDSRDMEYHGRDRMFPNEFQSSGKSPKIQGHITILDRRALTIGKGSNHYNHNNYKERPLS